MITYIPTYCPYLTLGFATDPDDEGNIVAVICHTETGRRVSTNYGPTLRYIGTLEEIADPGHSERIILMLGTALRIIARH